MRLRSRSALLALFYPPDHIPRRPATRVSRSTASFIVAAWLPGHVSLQQPNQAAQALIHTQPAARHGLKA